MSDIGPDTRIIDQIRLGYFFVVSKIYNVYHKCNRSEQLKIKCKNDGLRNDEALYLYNLSCILTKNMIMHSIKLLNWITQKYLNSRIHIQASQLVIQQLLTRGSVVSLFNRRKMVTQSQR